MGQKTMTEENLAKVDVLRPIADELGCTLAQLAIAWAASNPDVSTVITGATKAKQARTLCTVPTTLELDDASCCMIRLCAPA